MLNSGRRGRRSPDLSGILSVNEYFNQKNYPIPIISSWYVLVGGNPAPDTALSTAGGETVIINGGGFYAGCSVVLNGTALTTTLLSPTQVQITTPALAAGSYTIYLSNTDGATAIYVPGIIYSGTPTFTSPAAGTLGSMYETQNTYLALGAAEATMVASAAATPITYTVVSGSLPPGTSLNSSTGVITGNTALNASSTTYNFTVSANNAYNESVTRSFSITVNPDVVTWSNPALNGTLPVYEFTTPSALVASDAAGYTLYTLTYTSNVSSYNGNLALNSTGTWTGNVGSANSATVNNNVYFTATATSTNTTRFANSNITLAIVPDVVTFTNPAANGSTLSFYQGVASSYTITASDAAGFPVQFVSNTIPTGLNLISNGYVYGTATVSNTMAGQLIATANTTGRAAYLYFNWVVSVANDTYFKYTTLLLNAENPTGNSSIINNNYIQDTSNAPVVLTRTGNPTPNSFGPYGNNWSILFNGTTDYLTFPGSNTALQGIAYANMTLEFWIYLPNPFGPSNLTIIQKGQTSVSNYEWGLYLAGSTNSAGGMSIRWQPNSGSGSAINNYSSSGLTINTSTWYHMAISVSGTTVYFFLNGASAGSATVSLSGYASTVPIGIANCNNGTNTFQACYISNLRILKGTALYTSAFTPPTTPLTAVTNTVLLTAQSNRFLDNSTTASILTPVGTPSIQKYAPFNYSNNYTTTIDGGSIYFNGTTDYVANTTPPANIINWGAPNFTVEYWVYPIVFSSGPNGESPVLGNMTPVTATNDNWSFGPISSGAVKFYYFVGNSQSLFTSATITANQWYHLVFVNSSNYMTIYINGVASAQGSVAGTPRYSSSYTLSLGCISTTYFNGYVSDIRITNGVVYASNFTPPTTPLTPIANTTLMINGTSGAIVDKARQCVITTIGNAKSNTTTFKFGSASMQFSGTGDYLISEANNLTSFGSGPFTVEGWVYFNTVTGAQYILDTRTAGTSTTGMAFSSNATGYPVVTINNTTLITGSSPFTPNTWIHFAVVRTTSNVVTTYLNGSNVGGVTSTVSLTDNYLTIGTSIDKRDTTSTNHLNGYLDDVRVSRYPRYVANFTPPTATSPER
jgi:hypothetical protein